MAEKIKVNWVVQKGYLIEQHLRTEGLSFEALDLIEKTMKGGASKMRTKLIGRLAKGLCDDYEEETKDKKLQDIKYGTYAIGVGTGFQIMYGEEASSRIIYIGSGGVLGRLKSHLSGKLFDFARELQGVPLRFYIADLTDYGERAKTAQRHLEQSLLSKFSNEISPRLPLLNKNKAVSGDYDSEFSTGWDRPLHADKGKKTTNWLLKIFNEERFEGGM